jgi:radical SAM superfamily enzyme YgiQ (UPF0313 family)
MMKSIIFTGYENSRGLERTSGPYRIATVLRRAGWDCEVIDFFYRWNLDQLKNLMISRKDISWIGFSSTWINYSQTATHHMMLEFLQHIKETYPTIKILAGGQNPTLTLPIYNSVDYIISGFGEKAILEVLNHIYSNGNIKGIPRNNGWYVDANAFYPAWPEADLTVEYEDRDFIEPGETLSLELSRGCKFACSFCNFPILGVKEDTTRDMNLLRKELEKNYNKWGITNYQIADETLNDREEKLIKLGDLVESLDFELNFNAFIRGDILFAKPKQLELLTRARVWGHFYGIETFNHETGKIIGKGMHPDKIKEGLLSTKEYFYKNLGKYRGTVSLIYGLPKETKESILSALDWLTENWNDQSVISFAMNISTGGKLSEIDEDCEKYGYKILGTENRKLYTRHSYFSGDLVLWENENMNIDDAIELADLQRQKMNPEYMDDWQLWSMFSLTDIDTALTLNDNTTYLTDSLIEKSNQIKDRYIEKKLAL